MTREETKALMARIRAAYPGFCRGLEGEELRRVVDLWAEMLAACDAGQVAEGLDGHIRESRFAPTISEVLEAKNKALRRKQDLMLNDWGQELRYTPRNHTGLGAGVAGTGDGFASAEGARDREFALDGGKAKA